jgi:hypothetical protein
LKSETFGKGSAVEAICSSTISGSDNRAVLLKNGHLAAIGTNVNANCLVNHNVSNVTISASKNANSNDVRGEVLATFSPSGLIAPGQFVIITVPFDKQYITGQPHVLIEALNQETASLSRFIFNSGSGAFIVRFFNNTATSISASAVNFKYFVIE